MSVFRRLQVGELIFESAQDGIVAHAGGGQTSAFDLGPVEMNRVSTVATAGDSVRLPPAQPGLGIILVNHGANSMQVFGQPGDTINDVASATGVPQMVNSWVFYGCFTAGAWYTEGLGTGFSAGFPTQSAVNSLTAFAGGGQGSATPLTAAINRVTTVATIGDSVLLPVSKVGMTIIVSNAGAQPMDVFPAGTEVINSLAASTAVRINNGTTVAFWCSVAGTWHMSPAPPAPAKLTTDATGSQTIPAGEMTGAAHVVLRNTANGVVAWTTRTAAQLFADAGNVQPGDSYILSVRNEGNGTVTFTGGTNVTFTGAATVATVTTALFVVTFTDATHVAIQRIGGGIAN
jgi:hypothetical protein